ncbi:MAG: HAD family phosphatase [Lachnospiraceae bacterium]|nr:HAD family phosphatase [Lachnospiraceae bacterium]
MKLIMVDLDGTLFDTKDVNYRAYKQALNAMAYDIDYEYYCSYCNGKHYKDFLPKIVADNVSAMEQIHQMKKSLYKQYLEFARPNNNLIKLLENNKNSCKIALITTASKENTYDILERFSLVELFDLIVTRDDISKSKPNPEGYLYALTYFGVEANEAIIFEDSDVGIEAAKRCGVQCYVIIGYN